MGNSLGDNGDVFFTRETFQDDSELISTHARHCIDFPNAFL